MPLKRCKCSTPESYPLTGGTVFNVPNVVLVPLSLVRAKLKFLPRTACVTTQLLCEPIRILLEARQPLAPFAPV